jgi:hypothetical protein
MELMHAIYDLTLDRLRAFARLELLRPFRAIYSRGLDTPRPAAWAGILRPFRAIRS